MGDVSELKMQITPETPGRIPVLNPFESPSDYSNLHEQTLASPSVFKSTKLPTPGKFRWSIDQLAVINPVEIDPEEIHRQASYLSLSRIDKDVEDKRQKAIEEFFTKDVIVPSPWTDHDGKQPPELHPSKCLNSNNDSPVGKKPSLPPQKCNAACQTLLSLPVDFNLEAILGDYFRADDFVDQSPGNLSSSSLRRKLFLDVNGSISDSLPSASPGSPPCSARGSLEGQFSSSPIQNSAKKYSLGSVSTSPSALSSPTFSPIALKVGKTPRSEPRRFTFHSPEASSGVTSTGTANPSIRSPYIDGCSPIRNWSPWRLRGGPQCLSSLIRIPFTLEAPSEDEEADVSSTDVTPRGTKSEAVPLHQLNCETLACGEPLVVAAMSVTQSQSSTSEKERALLEDVESERENDTVDMVDPIDTVGESTWIKEPVDNGNLAMTDSVNGIAFSIENSHMCMSPLAESSVLPCESSAIQMDSGYNTQTCGSNITDIVGTESYCKENVTQSFEVEMKPQVNNITIFQWKRWRWKAATSTIMHPQ
ncbi:protein aurora borealis isoform X2 [Mastomys coucha]|uniref:protein aurora borealis isoform X2 n=1 Tax=Mastomys coucha TaxID=35658 RepID=UPI00126237AA|nr:protein aurora borealis isoform X2 [Mastomys coucha]